MRMRCGHSCESYCHYFEVTNEDETGHDHVKCLKRCERLRTCGHKCPEMCFKCKNGKSDGHLNNCNIDI